jgi:tetratricopeptide (TPR) repeat protein/O-antigen ligase
MSDRDDKGRGQVDRRHRGVTKLPKVAPEAREDRLRRLAPSWSDWLRPIAILAVGSAGLLSNGALFQESSQLVAAVVVLSLGLVVSVRDWSRVRALGRSRLGLLAIIDGAVLATCAILSVYHWASIRELLKAVALVQAFLLGAVLIDSEAVRDRFLVMLYWWSVAVAGAGAILFLFGTRLPQSWLGSYAVRTSATAAGRLSAFFGYANAFAAFLLVPIGLGVALAWHGGRRRAAVLAGLIIPLVAMQLTASRWGYIVLGMVLAATAVLWLRLGARVRLTRTRVVVAACLVLVVATGSIIVLTSTVSSSVPSLGERFTGIGAEMRNTDPALSSIAGRIAMMRDALRYSTAYPVFGSGPGTYASVYFRFRSTNFFAADPHSQAMLWLTETGGVGFVAQFLVLLAALGLMWIAGLRDARRDRLMLGAAVGVTGVVVHAMLDWDFQSYFLPLMVAVLCGVAASALAHQDVWLLRPWRLVPAGMQTKSRNVGETRMSWRPLAIAGTSLCIAVALTCSIAAVVAGKGVSVYGTDTARAARLFAIAQRINPLKAEYPYWYAKATSAMAEHAGDPLADRAIRDGFDRAVALNPWYIEYQIDQARYLLGRGDAKCVAVYENLTRIDPGDPGTFTSLAWAYHLLYQNDAKALQSLERAFAVDERYFEAWLVLGRIQEARGKAGEAIAAYWKAADVDQADVQALGRLGNLYEGNGNGAGAARAAFELMQRTPDSADAKSAFAAVGLNIKLIFATLEGREAKLSWTTSGKQVAESYRLVLMRPNTKDVVLVESASANQQTIEVSVPQAVADGSCRLRLYAMAPIALADIGAPWVAWVQSDDLVLKTP